MAPEPHTMRDIEFNDLQSDTQTSLSAFTETFIEKMDGDQDLDIDHEYETPETIELPSDSVDIDHDAVSVSVGEAMGPASVVKVGNVKASIGYLGFHDDETDTAIVGRNIAVSINGNEVFQQSYNIAGRSGMGSEVYNSQNKHKLPVVPDTDITLEELAKLEAPTVHIALIEAIMPDYPVKIDLSPTEPENLFPMA